MSCICHQCSGDSWSCPEHYAISRRFREAKRVAELALEGHESTDSYVLEILARIDAETAQRSKEFYRQLNEELDRRGQ